MGKHRHSVRHSEHDALSRGFDSGNYDNAYVSENFATAWGKRKAGKSAAYLAGYMAGFFSSYENHEIPFGLRDRVIASEHAYGPRMRALGIAVDPR